MSAEVVVAACGPVYRISNGLLTFNDAYLQYEPYMHQKCD